MKILKSEFFPKLFADFEEASENVLVLVQEYVSGRDLFQLIKAKGSKNGLPEDTCKFYFRQIIEAVRFMHANLICHRDLKLENILVSDRQRVKVIDFGFGIRTPEDVPLKIFCGTSSYMAPEIVRKSEYNGFKADIWALGVALYTMACLEPPFREPSITELFKSIVYKTPKPIAQYSSKFTNFVMAMLDKKKEMRPLITDLIDYFKDKQVPVSLKLSDCDKQNYKRFKEQQVNSFNKKRMIEKNTIGINHEFSALKNRIKAGNESFRAFFLKQQSQGAAAANIVIP